MVKVVMDRESKIPDYALQNGSQDKKNTRTATCRCNVEENQAVKIVCHEAQDGN